MAIKSILICVLAAINVTYTRAVFYLPGVKPRSFETREKVPLQVTALTSTKKQLPVDYYHLPFCAPEKKKHASENLGEVLEGDVITSSPYELEMKVPDACKVLCRQELNQKQMNAFASVIKENYRVHWLIDNLPVAMYHEKFDYYSRGFPVGFTMVNEDGEKQHYLNNHARMVIAYHEDPDQFQGSRIVGFEVVPFSIKHKYEDENFDPEMTTLTTCNEMTPAVNDLETLQSTDELGEVIFTYDVKWVRSDITWGERWDIYLKGNPNEEIHYFSIMNSLMIVLFLSGVVGMIMVRTLRKDISTYNEMQSLEEAQEETGWKLVHGDVFRSPESYPMVLSAFVGQGCHLLAMTFFTLVLALLGFLSPANRGGMLTAVIVLYVLGGSFSGYHSARLYKFFGKKNWKQCTLMSALLYPSVIFGIFFTLDMAEQFAGSSAAISFGTFCAIILLWLGVCTPLVFAGSFYGFKKEVFDVPVRTHNFPRFIPECQWYNRPMVSIALGGILPFGAVCIELFFIMSALWLHQIYYVFGFLMAVLFILIITCAEISVVMCYAQLCAEDYRWWWRSFFISGSSAVYLFLYAIWYFITKLNIIGAASCIVYFGNMLIISITFFLLTGSIGFIACFWFVRTIYGAIKVD
mmetsp:Transcript_39393/g.50262  ORF Transcript_39393/g.50262 Transcript_39393/m.50262 type:complete len:635 (+) Transcript_39393:150-2054(+)